MKECCVAASLSICTILGGCDPALEDLTAVSATNSHADTARYHATVAEHPPGGGESVRDGTVIGEGLSAGKPQAADYEEIAARIRQLRKKADCRAKLTEYALFMRRRSPYQGSVELERVKSMNLCGPPVPGRILTDSDVTLLCRESLEEIESGLGRLMAACFSYSHSPVTQGTVEDGEALLDYLIEHGVPSVQTRAKLMKAEFISQIVDRQDEALLLFDQGIRELGHAEAPRNEVLGYEKLRAAAFIYRDDLDAADAAAAALLAKYSHLDASHYVDHIRDLYWERIVAWKDVNAARALALWNEAKVFNSVHGENKMYARELQSLEKHLTNALSAGHTGASSD